MAGYDFGNLRRNDRGDNRRLLIATFVSVVFLATWNFFTAPSEEELSKIKEAQNIEKKADSGVVGGVSADVNKNELDKRVKKKEKKEVFLQNQKVKVGFDVANNRITFYDLKEYKEHEGTIRDVVLLDGNRFVEAGWIGDVQNDGIIWNVKKQTGNNIILQGKSGLLTFEVGYKLNDDYTISITQKVNNSGRNNVNVAYYNRISAKGIKEKEEKISAFHGVLSLVEDDLKEFNFSKIDEKDFEVSTKNKGWLGFSEKYWITALANQSQDETFYSIRKNKKADDVYQIDFRSQMFVVKAGETLENKSVIVISPKKLEYLNSIGERYNLPKFDKAIDFGVFFFLTKPFLKVLKYFYSISGNFGVAIIIFTILVRMVLFPLSNRSYKMMAKMKLLAPKIDEINKIYGDDKKAIQMETFKLYRDNKINPMSSIMPLICQIPVFFALYKVLVISIEMRDAPFLLWIRDLSSKDPSSIFNLFGFLSFSVPSPLQIGLLPCLMGLTMFIQQKLSPPPANMDKMQQKFMNFLPVIFTIMFASMPAGLVLYWVCSNIFTIIQQGVLFKLVNRNEKHV